MHDALFLHQAALDAKDVTGYAGAIGLDNAEFQHCLDTHKYENEIVSDITEGKGEGVLGTPTFFLGVVRPDRSSVQVARIIRGDPPYTVLKQLIDSLLNSP
jgi:protein-disulfide isomerase